MVSNDSAGRASHSAGHAFVQNLRRNHDDIATHIKPSHQLPAAFAELALTI